MKGTDTPDGQHRYAASVTNRRIDRNGKIKGKDIINVLTRPKQNLRRGFIKKTPAELYSRLARQSRLYAAQWN